MSGQPTSATLGLAGQIRVHKIANSNGMEAHIMNLGATVTSVRLPDGTEITCGFDNPARYQDATYLEKYPYFGATIGRYANRIKDGRYEWNGHLVQLSTNDRGNQLHGGATGFDRKLWTFVATDKSSATLELLSRSGEEGYPGNVRVQVTITITERNELTLAYFAETDAPTPLSLTNHLYINLAGFSEDIRSHHLQVNASQYLEKDESDAATGRKISCQDPMDFRMGKLLAEVIPPDGMGLDHYFVLNDNHEPAAILSHSNGRKLTVFTTEPGLQIYTSAHVSPSLARENGDTYGPQCAICFEPSRYPNGPNIPDSQGSITLPGNPYSSKTTFAFD